MTRSDVMLELREVGKVSIYACGPTVYDVPHVGHARTALTYDLLTRFLTWTGHEVTIVSNITDIDDRIIARAAEASVSTIELTERYTSIYIDQLHQLGVEDPDHRPRATQYISEMIRVIQDIEQRGLAYSIHDRGIYFDVSGFEGYGALAQRSADDLRETARHRIEEDDDKGDPLDFALWKLAKPGEPSWDSPWGPGRPGWHIECVAMSLNLLGDGFDIHGGGTDLIFPHHENERVQAEAAGHRFARHWLHSAMLNVDGEKMAKSVGNFTSLADALEAYGPRALRLAMIQAHYRSSLELSHDAKSTAIGAIERIDAFFRRARSVGVDWGEQRDTAAVNRFVTAMNDDLGTPDAVAVVFDLISAGNQAIDARRFDEAAISASTAEDLLAVLGLAPAGIEASAEIEAMVAEREQARADMDYDTADRIRNALGQRSIEIEDTPQGPIWHRRNRR